MHNANFKTCSKSENVVHEPKKVRLPAGPFFATLDARHRTPTTALHPHYATLQLCYTATMQHCNYATLHCHTALLHCYTSTLLHCYTAPLPPHPAGVAGPMVAPLLTGDQGGLTTWPAIVLHCTTLHTTVLYCTTLHPTVLHCTALHAPYCI